MNAFKKEDYARRNKDLKSKVENQKQLLKESEELIRQLIDGFQTLANKVCEGDYCKGCGNDDENCPFYDADAEYCFLGFKNEEKAFELINKIDEVLK